MGRVGSLAQPTLPAAASNRKDGSNFRAERNSEHKNAPVSDPTNDSPIRTFDDLLAHFHESVRPRSEFVVGAEMEKFGVYTATAAPVHYAGDRGILRVLETLERDHGWKADREAETGR